MKALPRPSGLLFPCLVLLACLATANPARATTQTVYIADIGTGTIYQVDVASSSSSIYLSSGLLSGVVGIIPEDSGDFLVSTVGSVMIRRINHTTKAITTVTSGGLMRNPDGITRIGNNVYVADPQVPAILGVNATTGAQQNIATGGAANGGPWLCAGGDGFLYVSRNDNSSVVRVDPTNGAQQVVTSGGFLSDPGGIVYYQGQLYVTSITANSIVRIDPTTGSQTILSQAGLLVHPVGLGVGPDGDLWTGLESSNRLVRVVIATGVQTQFTVSGLQTPLGILVAGTPGTPPPPPADPTACSATEARVDSVIFQWTPGVGGGPVDFYQIHRDGLPIATVPGDRTIFEEVPPAGPHLYCVNAANSAGVSAACCDSGQLKPPVTQPHLDFVRDVAHDQGGKVMLGWVASELDRSGGTVIGYRVWRRLPLSPHGGALRGLAEGRPVRLLGLGPQAAYWEALANLPAGHLSGYGYTAATLQDSLPDSNPSTAFFVSALTSDPNIFYDSNVDSGYSVDNLAPDTPQGMQGAYLASGGIKIQWLPSRAPDLSKYNIYRGGSQDFVPADFNRIGSTTDTTFVDPGAASYYYKLSAVDVHANESGFALLKPTDIPVAALVQFFEADPAEGGVQITLDLAVAPGAYGVRLWRSETESRLGAVALTPDAVPLSGTHYVYLDTPAPQTRLWYWVDLVSQGGSVVSFGPVTAIPTGAFPATILLAPQPNPSASGVDFGYTIGSDQGSAGNIPVRLMLFDTRGKLERVLVSTSQPVGRYQVHWDGNDGHGVRLRTGVYQYRLEVGAQKRTGKVIRI